MMNTRENNVSTTYRLSVSSSWKHKIVAVFSKDASMRRCHAAEVGLSDEPIFEGMVMEGPFVDRIAICFPLLSIVSLVQFVGLGRASLRRVCFNGFLQFLGQFHLSKTDQGLFGLRLFP